MIELFAILVLVVLFVAAFKVFGFALHLLLLPLKLAAGVFFAILLLPFLILALPLLLVAGLGVVIGVFLLVLLLAVGGIALIAGLLSI